MWVLDQIDTWLNRRDNEAVEEELLVVDASDAKQEHVDDAMKALAESDEDIEASDLESEARLMIARAKAYEREIDVAPSDSDDMGPPGWEPPPRRERQDRMDTDPERGDEAELDEVQ